MIEPNYAAMPTGLSKEEFFKLLNEQQQQQQQSHGTKRPASDGHERRSGPVPPGVVNNDLQDLAPHTHTHPHSHIRVQQDLRKTSSGDGTGS